MPSRISRENRQRASRAGREGSDGNERMSPEEINRLWGEENFLLQRISSLDFPSFVVPRLRGETTIGIVNVSEEMLTIYRFAFLQSTLRKPNVNDVGAVGQGPGLQASEAENSQASRRRAARQNLIEILGDKLSEYDEFLSTQNLELIYSHRRPPRQSTLNEFLLDGPEVRGNFDDRLWMPYSHAVRRLYLEPASRNWLDQDLELFLDGAELMGSVDLSDARQVAVERRDVERTERGYGEEAHRDEEDGNDENLNDRRPPPAPFWRYNLWVSSPWRHIRPFLFNRLFPVLATVVCIFNITAALGHVLLMNNPAPPKPSYIAGTLLTWFLTSGMMIGYGVVSSARMKDYVHHLVILAIATCGVVAFVFHFAGASNFASSFLVGITMAILLLSIWHDDRLWGYVRHLVILAITTCRVIAFVFHFAGASNFASSSLVGITMAILLLSIW